MESFTVNFVFTGVVLWATSFVLVRKALPYRSFDFCNRIISAMHAALAVCLASLSVENWRCPACPLASRPSPLQMRALAVTLSYLVYDFICCLFDRQIQLDNLFHHTVSIIGIGSCLLYETGGSELVAALWVSEISSPLLHLRELLKELGYRDTKLNLVVDILFAVVFTFGRMVGGPYVTCATWLASNPLLIKVMAMGLQLVSLFWFLKIIRMVRYKISKKMTSNKNSEKLNALT